MEDNEDILKRHHEDDDLSPPTQDASPTNMKRFKLNTDTLSQEPTFIGENNNLGSHQSEGSSCTGSTHQAALTANRNQLDDIHSIHNLTSHSTSSSSPFALHPILDELTNKPSYSNNHDPSGMRMSMSTILTETEKVYQEHSGDTTATTPSSSSSPLSTTNVSHSTVSPHLRSSPTTHEFDQQQTSPSFHHHRNTNISSMLMTQQLGSSTDDKIDQTADNHRQQQSITNEQLVRALTTSIPMDTTQQQPDDQQPPTMNSEPDTALPSTSQSEQSQVIKQEEGDNNEKNRLASTTTTHPLPSSTSITPDSYTSSSLPDLSAALRRLSGTTLGLEGQHAYYTKKDDVTPSELLGSALAAVARSQQHGSSTAAAAIGNLAAITANISHILNSNNNNVVATSSSSPPPTLTSVSKATTTVPTSSSSPSSLIPSEQQELRESGGEQALTAMVDQAGRTQQHHQHNESSAVNQDTVDRTASPALTSSPIRLHNHQPHHLHHHGSSPSLLAHHHHHHHYQHHYKHPHQTTSLYGQPMYPPPSSLHTGSSPMYNPPPPVTQLPKLIVNNDQVWNAVKGKKETNLGFYLYQPSMLLPNFQDHLNGIIQVRVPARYLTYENPKVKKRAIWGTGIYTDDSDIVTMAIHCGKFIPDYHDPELESNDPFLLAVSGKSTDYIRAVTKKQVMSPKTYLKHRDDTVPDHDIKVTLRVLPRLQLYASTIQHRIKSRQWGGNHDGISLYVEKVEQLKKGEARLCGRGSLKSNTTRYNSIRKTIS